ncbi:hypothetical protein CYMTET_23738, partial [Cymbomonas tetramitiformis]
MGCGASKLPELQPQHIIKEELISAAIDATCDGFEKLADDHADADLGKTICQVSKQKWAAANAKLAELSRVVEGLASLAAEVDPVVAQQLRSKVGGGVLTDMVETVLDIAQQCAARPKLAGARLFGALRCAHRLVVSAVALRERVSGEDRKRWRAALGTVRAKSAKLVGGAGNRSLGAALGASLLELQLTSAQLALDQLLQENAAEAGAKAVGYMAVGLTKTLLMMRLDSTLVEGAVQAAALTADAARRAMTRGCFMELVLVDQLAAAACSDAAECISEEQLRDRLKDLHQRLFRYADGRWEPTPGRWEPKAAFATLLADLAVRRFHTLSMEMLEMICRGEKDFIGLEKLMCLGVSSMGQDSSTKSDPSRTPLYLLMAWAQSLLVKDCDLEEWVNAGLAILRNELRRVAGECDARLAAGWEQLIATSACSSERMIGDAHQTLRDLDLENSRQCSDVRAHLAEIGQAVEALRSSLRLGSTVVDQALPVLVKASKLAHMLSGLDSGAGEANMLVCLRMALACARVQMAERLAEERSRLRDERGKIRQALEAELQLPTTLAQLAAKLSKLRRYRKAALSCWDDLLELEPALDLTVAYIEGALRGKVQVLGAAVEKIAAVIRSYLDAKLLGPAAHQLPQKLSNMLATLERSALPAWRKQAEDTAAWMQDLRKSLFEIVRDELGLGSQSKVGMLETLGRDSTQCTRQARVQACFAAVVDRCSAAVALRVERAVLPEIERLILVIGEDLVSDQDIAAVETIKPSGEPSELGKFLAEFVSYVDGAIGLLTDAKCVAEEAETALALCLSNPLNTVVDMLSDDHAASRTEDAMSCTNQGREALQELESAIHSLGALPTWKSMGSTAGGGGCSAAVEFALDIERDQGGGPTAESGKTKHEPAILQSVMSMRKHHLRLSSTLNFIRAIAEDHIKVQVAWDGANDALSKSLRHSKRLTESVQSTTMRMKVAAMEALESIVPEQCQLEGQQVTALLGEVCGALATPMLGLVGEAARGYVASRDSEVWRIRQAAAVCSLRVCTAASSTSPTVLKAADMARRQEVGQAIQAAVMRCWSSEPVSAVRAALSDGDALALELNAQQERGVETDEANEDAAVGGEEWREGGWAVTQTQIAQESRTQLAMLEQLQQKAQREPDPLKKQLLLVQCNEYHGALRCVSTNVHDIGDRLGVLVGFLQTMDGKLDAMHVTLSALKDNVVAMRGDVQRLAGRPVLEELCEKREVKWSQQRKRLRDHVHIPVEEMVEDENGAPTNDGERRPAQGLLKAVRTQFLESSTKSVLLVSGPAGSGKSTFVQHLELYLETDFLEGCKRKGEEVVLVKVLLPMLQNPLADLFHEALVRCYGLRDTQVHELRVLAQAGKVRLVFLLDAYDELKPQFLFRNLYASNNLEQYRRQQGSDNTGDAETSSSGSKEHLWRHSDPKVIITVRSELLMNRKRSEYASMFMPMEMSSSRKEAAAEAEGRFLELHIAPFTNQVSAYIHAKVALEVRGTIERQLGPIEPLSVKAGEELLKVVTQASALQAGGTEDLEMKKMMLAAATQAVTVAGGREKPKLPSMLLEKMKAGDMTPGFLVAATMAVALKHPPNNDPAAAVKKLCEQLAEEGEQQVWMHEKYEAALDGIPELKELTTTPFMVEIVTKILPKLEQWQGTDSSMRAQFLLLLSEEAAQLTWACISDWRLKDKPEGAGASPVLQRVQKALDKGPSGDRNDLKQLDDLAEEVTGKLRDRGILLEEPKLVEMAVERLKAKSRDAAETEWLQGLLEELKRDRQLLKIGEAKAVNALSTVKRERLEKAVAEWAIPHILRSGLQRPPVRRFKIYEMFLEMMVEREADKASVGAGAFDAETVRREGAAYAQRLALAMLAENVSKVVLGGSSDLFHQKSVWDAFLRHGEGSRHGELRDAARKAAPVRVTGGLLTFIHKTVQEYLCAAGLRGILRTILRDQVVRIEKLAEHLVHDGRQAQPDNRDTFDATKAPVGSGVDSWVEYGDRAVKKTLQKVGTLVVESEWAQVDLNG